MLFNKREGRRETSFLYLFLAVLANTLLTDDTL